MLFKHQISITADSGVGSTTTSKVLHNYLGLSPWRWVNAGAIQRLFAEERGMTIEEHNQQSLKNIDEQYDEKCDGMVKYFAEQDYVLFEGRLVHHFAPEAYHVLLVCDPETRAMRRTKDFPGSTEEEILNKIRDRDEVNNKRYILKYGPDVLWSQDKFDLVLDTVQFSPDEICQKIIEGHKKWLEEK
jgi:cytidylate kinase